MRYPETGCTVTKSQRIPPRGSDRRQVAAREGEVAALYARVRELRRARAQSIAGHRHDTARVCELGEGEAGERADPGERVSPVPGDGHSRGKVVGVGVHRQNFERDAVRPSKIALIPFDRQGFVRN